MKESLHAGRSAVPNVEDEEASVGTAPSGEERREEARRLLRGAEVDEATGNVDLQSKDPVAQPLAPPPARPPLVPSPAPRQDPAIITSAGSRHRGGEPPPVRAGSASSALVYGQLCNRATASRHGWGSGHGGGRCSG